MKIERDDVLCLDDIVFFQLKHQGKFADSQIYTNEKYGYLLDEIKEYKAEPLYKVRFVYKIDEVK